MKTYIEIAKALIYLRRMLLGPGALVLLFVLTDKWHISIAMLLYEIMCELIALVGEKEKP